MPMKIQDGTGGPLRLVAIPHDSHMVPPNLITATSPAVPIYSHIIVILSSSVLVLLNLTSNE